MKIGVPIDMPSIDESVSNTFGRSKKFLIYDTDSKEERYIDNFARSSQGGAGIKAAQVILDTGADVLITPRCGENAVKVLHESNIKIFQAISGSVQHNIDQFLQGKLLKLEDFHGGYHGNHGDGGRHI